MLIISHRGNLEGSNASLENSPIYIDKALQNNLDVEIDVWFTNNILYLGHDKPTYEINVEYLLARGNRLWCHAKNIAAIEFLGNYPQLNFFWHQNDLMTITSRSIPWLFPNNYCKNGITVMLQIINDIDDILSKHKNILGFCTDYPNRLSLCIQSKLSKENE